MINNIEQTMLFKSTCSERLLKRKMSCTLSVPVNRQPNLKPLCEGSVSDTDYTYARSRYVSVTIYPFLYRELLSGGGIRRPQGDATPHIHDFGMVMTW